MRNLAGDDHCDQHIRKELVRAGIQVVDVTKAHPKFPFSVMGKRGEFEFNRRWDYWTVTGKLPVEIARELYEDQIGRSEIRAGGYAGGHEISGPVVKRYKGKDYVTLYHIDSAEGLSLFVKTLRTYGLA